MLFRSVEKQLRARGQTRHELGREDRSLAILGEGNCSARLSKETFLVKASGSCLHTLTRSQLTECDMRRVSAMIDMQALEGAALEKELMASRIRPDAPRPSIETAFHAWLLQQEGIHFVGHCHPVSCNIILCSMAAEKFASERLFPDQVVCCGPQSIYVPYCEPGLPLAREIRAKVVLYSRRNYGRIPRLILLGNHGVIAIGGSASEVLSCILMAEKAAQIFIGAVGLGGPVFLPQHQAQRIDSRGDEAYRRGRLNR